MTSREAVQNAETSRILAMKRQEDERIAREKQEAADREAAARAQADESARQAQESARQRALADAQAAESARRAAEQARRAAEEKAAAETARASEQEARLRAQQANAAAQLQQAEQARLAAQQAEQKAQESERLRLQAEQAQQQLRQQLLQQFNLILETRDTARGLIVNVSDVLFDFNKYTLRPAAREKLAKISGIILSHPGLRLEVDGYTDGIGSEAYNMKLSEQRAGGVRDYLIGQGLAQDNVTSRGFGKENPVASNDTAAGRQKNRRVEMVVSGDIIGTPIGPTSSSIR